MSTPYRGRVEIKCMKDRCDLDSLKANIGPECFTCESSEAVMLDLDEKPVGTLKKKNKKTFEIKEKEESDNGL